MADESQPVEEKASKRKAKDNAWYRLATLHGEPSRYDYEMAVKNRVTWNRWMTSRLPDTLKTTLLEKGWARKELTPFTEDQLSAIEARVGWTSNELTPSIDDRIRTSAYIETRVELPISAEVIDFSYTEFEDFLYVKGFIFPVPVSFRSAAFSRDADFRSAAFSSDADFRSAAFSSNASFNGAAFSGYAGFHGAAFSGRAGFHGVAFSGRTDFSSAVFNWISPNFRREIFHREANFSSAVFIWEANFSSAVFGYTDFGDAVFSREANFANAVFSKEVHFLNAEMKGPTGFSRAAFSHPPLCLNAKLHEGTIWDGVRWPETPQDAELAKYFIIAYERLKMEMDKLKKHGDELDFFALEQQCRRVVLGRWKGFPIAVYGFLSDYGRSYFQPLSLLVATVLIGMFLFAADSVGFWTPVISADWRQALGVSFASTFSLLSKFLIKPEIFLSLSDWSKAVSALQSILGIVLLFLFGLGIRNRFRMK